MIAERAGQSFSLLILDEVFGSLDESRRHNVVELLRRLHDRFEQVILITHIESVREGLDRVLTVRYDEAARVSRVAQETGGGFGQDTDAYAAEAGMVWRCDRGEIIAFNVVHRSGVEGWMGPIAIRSEHQGVGSGKEIVRRGVDWLKVHGANVIGLETMPRTMDNIGFYSSMGFVPGRLTLTTTVDASYADRPGTLYGRLSSRDKDDMLGRCRDLLESLLPGYDHS